MSNKISFISGNFNIIHAGHIRLFKYAKKVSDYLIVGVNSDKISNEYVYIKEKLRFDALKELGLIDKVVLINTSLKKTLQQTNPDIVIKGLEFQNRYNEEEEYVKEIDYEIIFSSGDISFSSSKLFNNIQVKDKIIPYKFMKRHNLNKDIIKKTIKDFSKLKILTVGDLIIDEYINCSPIGLSKETNNIVYSHLDNKKYLGGSGIVAAHASQISSESHLVSICGNDEEMIFAKDKLSKYNVKNMIFKSNLHKTIKKTRFVNNKNNLFRLNYLNQVPLTNDLRNKIFLYIKKIIHKFDILIFSDFNYGCIDEILITKLVSLAKINGLFVSADSQASSQFGKIDKYVDVDLITPTEYEARSALKDNLSGLIVLSEKLRNISNVNNILLTQGEDGVFIHNYNKDKKIHENDTLVSLNNNPIDSAGAGDSMLVSTSLVMKLTNNLWLATLIGSLFSSIQISRKGNIPITKKELVSLVKKI